MSALPCMAALLLAVQSRQPTTITLKPGVDGPEFTRIVAIRELSDGRTLVTDDRERALFVVDWSSLDRRKIGRTGEGPGEYQSPGDLEALTGDSTYMPDHQNGKWYLLHGDRITSTLRRDHPLARLLVDGAEGADANGRLLMLHGSKFTGRYSFGADNADSVAVLLVNRGTLRADTLLQVRGAYLGFNTVRGRVGGGVIIYVLSNPFAVGDQAILFPDGWIAVAIASPYHVVWRSPNGSLASGRPLPDSRQRVDERVKVAAVDEQWPPSPHTPSFKTTDFINWPEVVPPFVRKALLPLPDGQVAIRRTRIGRSANVRYDIVNRQGNLTGILELAPNERLVGFGKRSAYVVLTDDDGIEHLRRHPWP